MGAAFEVFERGRRFFEAKHAIDDRLERVLRDERVHGEGGGEDPKLRPLRLDAKRAQIWLNENNLLTGVRLLLGGDPKKEYKDKIAEVELPE
jgi:hypothetical protein